MNTSNVKDSLKQSSQEKGAVAKFLSKLTSGYNPTPGPSNGATANVDLAPTSSQVNNPEFPNSATAVAMFGYQAENEDELTLKAGETVEVISQDPVLSGDEGWWAGKIANKLGVFPSNFVTVSKQVAAATNSKIQMYEMLHEDDSPVEPSTSHITDPVSEEFIREISTDELQIGRVIGYGGFGTVYLGSLNGKTVAVKEARPLANQPAETFFKSVKEEATTFSRLHHVNIIGFEGLCLRNEYPQIVLEYAEGGSLNKFLRGRTLPPTVIINWALQIAQGMNYLHAAFNNPIIHRDLKSSNVLIKEPINEDADDLWVKTLKIADFGLARETGNSMRMTIAGTWAFMAPESISSSRFSRASDVWSYGVLLWELLTGEQPYKDMEEARICFGVGHGNLTLPIPKTCPEAFGTLLKSCWEKDAHLRPTFAAIIAELQRLSDSHFVTIPIELFSQMQEDWRDEVKILIEDLRKKEQDMHDQYKRLALQRERNKYITERIMNLWRDLRESEILVVQKQINLVVQNHDDTKPKPPKRIGKFKRSKLMKMGGIGDPTDFRHKLTVRLSAPEKDAQNVMQMLAEEEESDRVLDVGDSVMPRFTAIENPEVMENTMPLETARKYQEAKALAEFQCDSDKHEDIGDDKLTSLKKAQTPDSIKLGGLYDSDDFVSDRQTPQSSQDNSLNRVMSNPVSKLLLRVTQVFTAVPIGGKDASAVASSSFLQFINGVDTSSNDDNLSNESLAEGGKTSSTSGLESPKGFKKSWKRKSPAHKRKAKSLTSSPTTLPGVLEKSSVIPNTIEEEVKMNEDVTTDTLLSMSSVDSIQAANKLAPALAIYQTFGDVLPTCINNANIGDDCDVISSLDPLKPSNNEQATTNRAFSQDEQIYFNQNSHLTAENPQNMITTHHPPNGVSTTTGQPHVTISTGDTKRKRGHGRQPSDGCLATLDNAVRILQHHKTAAEKAKETNMDPELYRLPAPEIPARKKHEKSLSLPLDVERPKSLPISRPRPVVSSKSHIPQTTTNTQSVTTNLSKQQPTTTSQNLNQAVSKCSIQQRPSTNHVLKPSYNQSCSKQVSLLTTNPYYGLNAHNGCHSGPPDPDGPSPFDIKFPNRRGKSESDSVQATQKRPTVVRAMSTVVENRSILDTPMGEDRDAHPTLVSYDPRSSRIGTSKIDIDELERQFLP